MNYPIETQLQKIDVKLDKIHDSLTDIAKDVAVNTSQLGEHMERTVLNERRISRVENWTIGLLTSILLGVLGLVIK